MRKNYIVIDNTVKGLKLGSSFEILTLYNFFNIDVNFIQI